MLFDAPEPNSGMPVVWPRVWLNGNNENYATKDADNSAVIVLRHAAIPLAMFLRTAAMGAFYMTVYTALAAVAFSGKEL